MNHTKLKCFSQRQRRCYTSVIGSHLVIIIGARSNCQPVKLAEGGLIMFPEPTKLAKVPINSVELFSSVIIL